VTVERVQITDRAQWLSWRKYDITASVVGAVFGLHPYVSPLRLYVDKQGLVALPEQADSGPLRRGRILESAVAAAVEEQWPTWKLEKCNEYFRDDEIGLAATPDFFIHGDPRGLGVLQAKTAAPSVFEREWKIGDDGFINPPMWITLQATVEMMLTGAVFGAVACLVVDPYKLPCHVVEIPRHEAAEKKIKLGVDQFWKDIEEGREPGPDYGLDRELLKSLMPTEDPAVSIDLTHDNEVIAGLIERADLRERIKADEEKCKAIETMLMSRMRDAAIAMVPDFTVSWKTEARKGYTVQPSTPRVLRIRDKRKPE
jgi:predicted phage-related endonuclease